ncbi:MAG: hypothetical protein ACR65O_02205, partial [Methylomicrobium sp.]
MRHWNQSTRKLIAWAIAGYCLGLCPILAGAAEIIVNASVPAARYSRADARAIFAMHLRIWPNGEPIKVFTLADDD